MYHGSLYTHPAAAPFVDINNDPVTYIKMVLDGNANEVGKVAKEIVSRRGFENLDELKAFIQEQNERVSLKSDTKDIILFIK